MKINLQIFEILKEKSRLMRIWGKKLKRILTNIFGEQFEQMRMVNHSLQPMLQNGHFSNLSLGYLQYKVLYYAKLYFLVFSY